MSRHRYGVNAPWTDEDLRKVIWWQKNLHPYTCPNRSERKWHGGKKHKVRYGDLGALVPTPDGWHCPDCGYTQNWYRDFDMPPEPIHE